MQSDAFLSSYDYILINILVDWAQGLDSTMVYVLYLWFYSFPISMLWINRQLDLTPQRLYTTLVLEISM